VSAKAFRWLSALVMITVATGCDNVDWGGAEVHLVRPPSTNPDSGSVQDSLPSEPDLGLPEGPLLYRATRVGDEVTVVPVAEVRGDSLIPVATNEGSEYRTAFAEERLPLGKEFILFAGGVRVGRTRVERVDEDPSFCTARPTASGTAEIVPTAAGLERFLALPAGEGEERPFGEYEGLEDVYAQRAASVEFQIAALRRHGARFPEGDLVNSRVDMRAMRLGGVGPEAFAATFVNLDAARIAPADSAAHATFLLGVEEGSGYRPAYEWHRSVATDGKGVPVFWEQMDWDGDGSSEILLEVLGEEHRWNAAIAVRGGQWMRIFEDPCGTRTPDAGG
jgi:hypothetical protein